MRSICFNGLYLAGVLTSLISTINAKQCVKTCVMPKNQTVIGGDDSPGILAAINECGNNSRVVFEAGVTYNLFTPWKLANINNIEFIFEGNLTLSTNVTEIQSVVRNSRIFPGQWIQVRGDHITFTGSKKADSGWFNCEKDPFDDQRAIKLSRQQAMETYGGSIITR